MIPKTISYIIRGIQTLFAVVIIALTGNMISNSGWNIIEPLNDTSSQDLPSGGNPAEVNYAMFLGAWTLISMGLFIPLTLKPRREERYLIGLTVLDGLTALFYMCGGFALAAAMGIHSCSNEDYIVQNRITNNAIDQGKRCREAQAVTAFIWLNFLTFIGTTVFSAHTLYRFSHPKAVVEETRESSEMATGEQAETDLRQHFTQPDILQQPTGGGIPRLWGDGAASSTVGPEIADVRSDDGHWSLPRRGSIESSVAPEVADRYGYHL
jgi:hypothetical protein